MENDQPKKKKQMATSHNQQQPATTINVVPVRLAGLDSRHEYHLLIFTLLYQNISKL
jgi:hypothetical protein